MWENRTFSATTQRKEATEGGRGDVVICIICLIFFLKKSCVVHLRVSTLIQPKVFKEKKVPAGTIPPMNLEPIPTLFQKLIDLNVFAARN